MKKTKEELEIEISVLRKQHDSIGGKLAHRYNAIKKIQTDEYKEIISKIPSDVTKIKPAQWRWILSCNNKIDSKVKNKFCHNLLWDNFNIYISGFHPETDQVALVMSSYTNIKKFDDGFKIIRKYIKECKSRNRLYCIQEAGIYITIHLDGEDRSPIALYKKKDRRVYIHSYHGKKTELPSLKRFYEWVEMKRKYPHMVEDNE